MKAHPNIRECYCYTAGSWQMFAWYVIQTFQTLRAWHDRARVLTLLLNSVRRTWEHDPHRREVPSYPNPGGLDTVPSRKPQVSENKGGSWDPLGASEQWIPLSLVDPTESLIPSTVLCSRTSGTSHQPSQRPEMKLPFSSLATTREFQSWYLCQRHKGKPVNTCRVVAVRGLKRVKKKVKVLVAQSCLTLCDPMDCSLPGFSVHGILHVRILEWVAIPFSRGSSWPRDQTWVSCIAGKFFTIWATGEAQITLENSHQDWTPLEFISFPPLPLRSGNSKNKNRKSPLKSPLILSSGNSWL